MDEYARNMRLGNEKGGFDMTNIQSQGNEEGTDRVSGTLGATELKPASKVDGDNEFKLTVRKLEMPVRPRGVLAE